MFAIFTRTHTNLLLLLMLLTLLLLHACVLMSQLFDLVTRFSFAFSPSYRCRSFSPSDAYVVLLKGKLSFIIYVQLFSLFHHDFFILLAFFFFCTKCVTLYGSKTYFYRITPLSAACSHSDWIVKSPYWVQDVKWIYHTTIHSCPHVRRSIQYTHALVHGFIHLPSPLRTST